MKRLVLFLGTLVFILGSTAFGWTRTDTLRVVATDDDGGVRGSSFSSTETSNFWGRFSDATVLTAWFRMMSKIPAGRQIDSVVPIPQAYSIAGTDTSYWRFSKTNNVAAPTSLAEYNAIPLTNDSVVSYGGGAWSSGTRYRLTGEKLTTGFKETYEQGDCDSGEYVILRIKGANLGNVDRNRRTLDYGFSSGYAFWLEVTHSDKPSSVQPRRRKLQQIGSLEPNYIEYCKVECAR
jgi:hypothetical protein